MADVSFQVSDVKVSRSRTVEIEIEFDQDPIEFDLEYAEAIEDSIQVRKTSTGWRVGYLCYDEYCNDPTEDSDGMGYIYTGLRHTSNEVKEKFYAAIGRDRYGEKAFDLYQALQELAVQLWPNRVDKEASEILRDPDEEITFENIKRPYRGKWKAIIEQHKDWGDFGDPDAVRLNIYQHGGISYEVADTSGYHADAQWDWSFGSGVWVPDKVLREDEAKGLTGKARHAKMVEWAGQCVKTMNEWMNGQVFGVVTQDYDKEGNPIGHKYYNANGSEAFSDHVDACWGFIGHEYAEEELERQMKWEPEKAIA